MPHTTEYNRETKIIESKLTGRIFAEEIIDIMQNNIKISEENDCYLWLNDFTDSDMDILEMDVYFFPTAINTFANTIEKKKNKIRRAIVVKKLDETHMLAEVASNDKSQFFRAFDNIEEARKWLRKH